MSHLYNSHAGIIVCKKELFTTEPQRSPSKRNGHKGVRFVGFLCDLCGSVVKLLSDRAANQALVG
jgi:hypothetical protein